MALNTVPMLRFEIAERFEVERLSIAWRELERRAVPSFFLTWHWIGCWLAVGGFRPMLLTGTVGETIVLLALLLPPRWREIGLRPTHEIRLHTSGDESEDVITIEYNGFLVDRAWAGRAETAALAYLAGGVAIAGRRMDQLHLRGVPDSYETMVPAGLLRQVAARKPSWRVDLEQVRASGLPYLDGLSANTRQQIRRSVRLYEQRGKLVAERAQSLTQGMLFLAGLRELHQRYWSAKGEPGGFGYPFFERFVLSLIARGLPSGAVELVQVSCGEQPIGYLCNFIHDGHVHAYLSGLRYEADPRLKPGLVSHALCIERHVAEGARLYDFMAGEARYKANLGKPGPQMLYLLVKRPLLIFRAERLLRLVKHRLAVGRVAPSRDAAPNRPDAPAPCARAAPAPRSRE